MIVFFVTLLLSFSLFISDAKGIESNNNTDPDNAAIAGEQIFKEKCSVCHKTTEQQLVGPGLKGVMERRDEKWVDKWLENPAGVLKSGDKTAVELKKHFFRTMPTLPEMQEPVNRKKIIEFLKTLKEGGER